MDDLFGELWLELGGLTEEEAVQETRREYERLYLDKGRPPKRLGIRNTHDSREVIFFEDRFKHAFFKSSHPISRSHLKDVFAWDRAERVRWIGPLIAGTLSDSECWLVPPKGNRRYHTRRLPNRLYILWRERYVVWLEPLRSGAWKFSSAYPAGGDVRRYCQAGSTLWQKNTP
jgi:hypothetical protein